jgi:hypothetical protein
MDALFNPYTATLVIVLSTITCFGVEGFSNRILGEISGFCIARLIIRAVRGLPASNDPSSMLLASFLVEDITNVLSTVGTKMSAIWRGSRAPQQPAASNPAAEIEEIGDGDQRLAVAKVIGDSLTLTAEAAFKITGRRNVNVILCDETQSFRDHSIVVSFNYGTDGKLQPLWYADARAVVDIQRMVATGIPIKDDKDATKLNEV